MDSILAQKHLVIVGGGPSGLRAAEIASAKGFQVSLHEGKPSVGRKFLVAGRGGLNLSHSENIESFIQRYHGTLSEDFRTSLIKDFDPSHLRSWAEELGIATFVGSSGRIFPVEKKAAPLLRAWVRRIKSQGTSIVTRSLLQDIHPQDGRFQVSFLQPQGISSLMADAVILALGGASWPQTGSTGEWVTLLKSLNLPVNPLQSANCGWETNWHPDILPLIEGLPLKNLIVSAHGQRISGELLITRYGLEGGILYQLGYYLRTAENPTISIDFKPTTSLSQLLERLPKGFRFPQDFPPRSWNLSKGASLLLKHRLRGNTSITPHELAALVKNFSIPLRGPRPLAEAISTAGGVSREALDESLMVRHLPGLFLAGEMLDWEAPTGGYLLQGCFATGTRAALGACRYLADTPP